MTPRFFKSFILVNIFKILTNLFLTFIRFFRKTSAIAVATLPPETLSDVNFTLKVLHNCPYGTRGTSVSALASTLCAPQNLVAISSPECTNCEYSEPSIDDRLDFVLYEKEDTPKSTSHWLRALEHETHERCPQCFSAILQ